MVALRTTTVALVGNPNTGKTTLFNKLAGMRQRVGNYPGVTVETKKGRMTWQDRSFDLVDLPGTYSLAPRSPDEMVAVDLILGQQEGEPRPDVVVSIVDASNLERNLYLTTQALELGVPVVVALNMIDIAQAHGISIDAAKLSSQLGVPVVPIQANKAIGLDELKRTIAESALGNGHGGVRSPAFPEAFEKEATWLHDHVREVPMFLVRRLLLDVGGWTEQRLAQTHDDLPHDVRQARERLQAAGCPVPAVEAKTRYAWIREAVAGCIQRPEKRLITWTDRFDRVLTHRIWGTLIFLVIMLLVFMAIFEWARPLMKLIGDAKDWLADLLKGALPPGPLTSLLTDGILEGVGAVVVFLPQILILFGFIAILEDCGYMARAAFLMDKLMSRCGLSGKSFIPMLSSVACAVPGIMATRVIENRRDRLATILVAPLMSCSARLPVYILLIAAFLTDGYAWWVPGLTMFSMYLLGLVLAPLVALLLKRTLLRGETPVFVMEMPLYKLPSPRLVLRRMYDSAWAFLRRAGTIILASMIVVWALLYFPSSNADGVGYDALIAETVKPVKEQKEKLDELQKSIAAQKKELARLDRQADKGDSSLGTLFGLLSPSAAERDARRAELRKEIEPVEQEMKPLKEAVDPVDDKVNELTAEWKKNSWLGQAGQAIEPVVKPLGWDWRIGVAALASFPAREVVVGTLGIIYKLGKVESDEIRETGEAGDLGKALKSSRWNDDPNGELVFTVPVALSLMVFFALCCQCASTLAVIRRETRSWVWPIFTFVYMTTLAYIGALAVYQVGSWLS
jgi:ferrous iron transport protein B